LAWTAINGIIWAVTLWAGYQVGHIQDDWRAEHLIVAAALGAGIGAATSVMWLWPPVLETARSAVPKVIGTNHADASAALRI
jgi:hypothetical protein